MPKTAMIASPMYFSTVPPDVALDHGAQVVEVAQDQQPQRLRVEPLAERRRSTTSV